MLATCASSFAVDFRKCPWSWDCGTHEGDLSKAKARIGGGATTHVVTTLAEAQEQVRLLIQPLLPPPEK